MSSTQDRSIHFSIGVLFRTPPADTYVVQLMTCGNRHLARNFMCTAIHFIKQESRMAYGTVDEALMFIWYFGRINITAKLGARLIEI